MTKFFSNTWVKCISLLLIISIIAGGLLTALNFLLYVSPAERSGRAIKKIYGEDKQYEVVLDCDGGDQKVVFENVGSVNKIYKITNGEVYDLLFQTTGDGGYKNGTITLWTKVAFDGTTYSIEKVILESYDKQTLMSKLGEAFYSGFILEDVTKEYEQGKLFAPKRQENSIDNIVTGATKSANAGCNAVNCVLKYLGENYED